MHRPEEALDIQSELIFVNALTPGMKLWYTDKLSSPATPHSALTVVPEGY